MSTHPYPPKNYPHLLPLTPEQHPLTQNIPPLTSNYSEYTSSHPCQLITNVHLAPSNQNIPQTPPPTIKNFHSPPTTQNNLYPPPHLIHNIKPPIIIYRRVMLKFESQHLDFYSFFSIVLREDY